MTKNANRALGYSLQHLGSTLIYRPGYAVRSLRGQLARTHRQRQIMPQVVVIVQVLVAQGNADEALHHQGLDLVLHQASLFILAEITSTLSTEITARNDDRGSYGDDTYGFRPSAQVPLANRPQERRAGTLMALAPIRGAPPGALNPDFPVAAQSPKPGRLTAGPDPVDQPTIPKVRQRYSPIEIATGGVSLTFRVVPEQPAIARASMTVEVVAVGSSSQRMIGFLRMSASKTRTFLEDLSNERSPVVASGDEDGDVQIEFAVTEAGPALAVQKRGQRDTLGRWAIKPEFNLKAVAADLLADLGLPYAPK